MLYVYRLLTRVIYYLLFLLNLNNKYLSLRWQNRLKQGLAFDLPNLNKVIWIHAVSVGELSVAIQLVNILNIKNKFNFLITTTTFSGAEQIKPYLTDSISHAYMPFDIDKVIGRFVEKINPIALIVIETEIWPNWIECLHSNKIPIMLANGRLSSRSFKKYKIFKSFFSSVLLKIDKLIVQTESIADRFLYLGADKDKLQIIPNLKYDNFAKVEVKKKHIKWINNRPVILAASTHSGEEALLIESYKDLKKEINDLAFIVVPRHPKRACEVIDLCSANNLSYKLESEIDQSVLSTNVLIVDSIGKLINLYAAVDIAIIGGSFVKHGGHNPIEAIAQDCFCLTGQYTFNFESTYQNLLEHKAIIQISSVDHLVKEVLRLFNQPGLLLDYKHNAVKYVKTIFGKSTQAYEKELEDLLEGG